MSIFLFSISFSYSAYQYNASWTDLEVYNDGWCANLEIPFTVYNKSEYLIKDQIKDNLCKVNETPEDDKCSEFETISGNVKIYDGPFAIEDKKLLDVSLSKSSFSYTFTKEGGYLIEVFPTGKFNDWYVEDFTVLNCKLTNYTPDQSQEGIPLLKNQSFSYEDSKTIINLTNSGLNSSSDLIVKIYHDPVKVGLGSLPNTIKIVQILGKKNFSSMEIISSINDLVKENEIYNVYKYNSKNSNWTKISNTSIINNKVTISSAEIGIYAIASNKTTIVENVTTTPVTQQIETNNSVTTSSSNTVEEVSNSANEKDTNNTTQKSSGPNKILIYSLIGLLLIVLGGVGFTKMKKKGEENSGKEEENPENGVLSYSSIVSKTQEYVSKYKQQYSQDQIYRALKEANVPKDIIDKVFSMEY